LYCDQSGMRLFDSNRWVKSTHYGTARYFG
jgi:hypothetical protein